MIGMIENLTRKLRKIRNKLIKEENIEDLIKKGLKIGDNLNIQSSCIIDGSHCWLIEIGNNVTLAPRVHILAHDASTKHALGYTKIGKVKIGDNVFVGANTTILPNVKIGNNVIIGANSLVNKSIDDNCVVAGNPAKVIQTYQEYIEKNRKMMKTRPVYDEKYTLRNKKITQEMKKQMIKELEDGIGYVE